MFFILSGIIYSKWYGFFFKDKDNLFPCISLMYMINVLSYYFKLKGLSAEKHTHKTILYPNGTGVITSPGYPQNYPDNANYIWILNTGSQYATVTFSILDLKISKQYFGPCDDYLKVSINMFVHMNNVIQKGISPYIYLYCVIKCDYRLLNLFLSKDRRNRPMLLHITQTMWPWRVQTI